ncbi:MAG: hypothetical protein ACHQ4H_12715 [Ktedonobacterales bacterium]
MSGGGPELAIGLRDGTTLRVTAQGLWIGQQLIELEKIQDARQVAPEPETMALRVAGAGMVEFQPARAGEGALALEALYRLRPSLRPPGFEARTLPAGFPAPPPPGAFRNAEGYAAPLPQYGPIPGGYVAPPPAYPAPPVAGYVPPALPAAGAYPPQYAAWTASRGELTPYPRNFGGLLGAIFQLYNRHLGKLLLIAVVVALVPALLGGVAQLVLLHALGLNPLGGTAPLTNVNCTDPTVCNVFAGIHVVQGDALVRDLEIGGAAQVLAWLLGGWQLAALAIASRQAVLGRPVRLGASLGGGVRRLVPAFVAWAVVQVLCVLLLVPAIALYGVLLVNLFPNGRLILSTQAEGTTTVTLAACLGCLALLGGVIGVLFFQTRLGLAPYAAAAERVGPFRSLARSWRLTRGHFWRLLGVWVAVAVLVQIPTYIAGQFATASAPLAYLVALPLVALFTMPLVALTYVTLLYDLRLRREGYPAVTTPAPTRGKVSATSPVD